VQGTIECGQVSVSVVLADGLMFDLVIAFDLNCKSWMVGEDSSAESLPADTEILCPIYARCARCARIVSCWSPFRTTRDHLIGYQETFIAQVRRGLW